MENLTEEVERGCGTRVQGGLYVETNLGGKGLPIEDFLVDEPKEIDATFLGVSKIGVTVVKIGDYYHILDWVGDMYYHLPSDFIEEVRLYGMSRRVPKIKDIEKLTNNSKIYLIHSKANLANFKDIRGKESIKCMCGKEEHTLPYSGNCISLLYAQKQLSNANVSTTINKGSYSVKMPSFEYEMIDTNVTQRYGSNPAIFMALPIHNLTVITDKVGDSHLDVIENADNYGLDLKLKDF